jgi:hypothetical protein
MFRFEPRQKQAATAAAAENGKSIVTTKNNKSENPTFHSLTERVERKIPRELNIKWSLKLNLDFMIYSSNMSCFSSSCFSPQIYTY